MKIVINDSFGGFAVSKEVYDELGLPYDGYGYLENKDFGIDSDDYNAYRSDPKLIASIEKLGVKAAGGMCASLKIVNVPNNIDWYIDDYDGMETVRELHRSWF